MALYCAGGVEMPTTKKGRSYAGGGSSVPALNRLCFQEQPPKKLSGFPSEYGGGKDYGKKGDQNLGKEIWHFFEMGWSLPRCLGLTPFRLGE